MCVSASLLAVPQAQLLVKSVTTYHVRVIKFSPFEPDQFFAAGRDNVRLYRLKGQELRGISVKLQVRQGAGGWRG